MKDMAEEHIVLHNNIAKCQACNFFKEHWRFPRETHGNGKASVMVVGESSHKPSIEKGKYYSAGGLRNTLLGVIDLDHQCYLTDLVKCDKKYLDTKEKLEIAAQTCYQFLQEEIDFVNPKIIIAVGKLAFRYLTGVTGNFTGRQDDGQQYYYKNIIVVPIIHPSRGDVHYSKKEWQKIGYRNSVKNIFAQAIRV